MTSFTARSRSALACLVAGVFLLACAPAYACSRDDTAWFETFLDTSCLTIPLDATSLDALGGLRLATNGVAVTTSWDSDTDFGSGVTWEAHPFAPVGLSTLATTGTGAAATLGLPTTLLPLDRGTGTPVLGPSASTVLDGDGVSDPAVVKVAGTYRMWYSGAAEDGTATAIFEATSPDGLVWTRQHAGASVLAPTPGSFDEHGVSGPDVVYDAADTTTPYRMWYSGQGSVYGAIGYATSTDGVTWVKHDDPSTPPLADPVITHGDGGSADSFGAGDPSVLHDGATWKLWYTGDDSSKKRIAYATSPDGVAWTKGGKVIAPEDPGANANYSFGAFAPAVWKTAGGAYHMLLTGRKIVSGSTFQTKIMDAGSTDGITWSAPSPAVNPAGNSSKFDYSNLDAPDVLADPGAGSAAFKLWYAGNTLDANGNFHTRIGYATSADGTSFSKAAGAQTGFSVLDTGAASSTFDASSASGIAVVAPVGATPRLAGFYSGVRGSDFKPRLGFATSPDGDAWSKVPVSAPDGGALFALSNAGFDQKGQIDPSALYDVDSGGGTDDWFLYFTALGASSTSIGRASAPQVAGTKLPDQNAWSSRTAALSPSGSAFDASAVSHPSIVKDAAASFLLYYGATDGAGTRTIGRAAASTATGAFASRTQVLTAGASGSFDAGGVADPVVVKAATGDYRMLYTGIEPGTGTARVGYATSTDGLAWTKRGMVIAPSAEPFAADELGVRPSGMLLDGAVLRVWADGHDRSGRGRAIELTTAFPTPVAPAAGIPNGSATYQLGDATTSVRDVRRVIRTSSGTGVTLWMSFLQPYSATGNEFWSGWFPVTATASSEDLHFLLTVRGIRWQARLAGAAGAPQLNRVDVDHAPVSFAVSGSATTAPILPPDGQAITAWGTLTATATLLQPSGSGASSGTLSILDTASGASLSSAPLNTSGSTSLDLSAVLAAEHPSLRARVAITGDGSATAVVRSLKLLYNAAAAPPPPPPPPAPPVLTLAATPLRIVHGQTATLTGLLTQSSLAVAGAPVTVTQQTAAPAAPAATGAATTDATGAYTLVVHPDRRTTYSAAYGTAVQPAVTVEVAPLMTLSVRRKGTKGVFRGTVAPAHPGAQVTIQVRRGSAWARLARVKLGATSSFTLKRSGLKPRAKYRFRTVMAADADHLAGASPVAFVDRMRVSLKISVRRGRATFTGVVAPRHHGAAVTIGVLRGGRFVTLTRTRLTRRSTFKVAKRLAKGTYIVQASTRDDRDHFGGTSAQRTVVVR